MEYDNPLIAGVLPPIIIIGVLCNVFIPQKLSHCITSSSRASGDNMPVNYSVTLGACIESSEMYSLTGVVSISTAGDGMNGVAEAPFVNCLLINFISSRLQFYALLCKD